MRTVAIVQARMGSTRFPAKTLADLGGATLLERVLERVALAARVDEVVVATTTLGEDDAVASCAAEAGFAVSRGSVEDVLGRYLDAARAHRADVVVRNTADEPFADPALIDEAHDLYVTSGADYVANNVFHVYPEGMDTEVLAVEALEIAAREATRPSDREHVTPFIWRQPERFAIAGVETQPIRPDLRLTVDYPGDLEFARALYAALPAGFSLRDVVEAIEARPDIAALCPTVARREGYERSVREEQP